ncbi:MAG: precorrin-2 dehydrogenase/sirohydrochlorin ferrochelatase family protein, partial [Vicinamibacterales bacterium]
VRIIERAFMPEDLDGAWFVTAAAHSAVNRAVHDAAEARHIFVNAVDDPRHATAYLGGTIARGGVTIAVSTSGEAPALAGLLREAIDDMLPSELGTWLQRARELSRRQRASGVPMERRRPQLLETLNRIYDKPKGLSPQSEGLSPRPKGLSPRSEGLSPQSEGLSPRSEGLSPRSEDLSTPTAQNVAPTIQNVATNLPPSREALRRTAGALAEAGQVCRSAEELESAQ